MAAARDAMRYKGWGRPRQAPGGSFARTGHAMRAMEAVAAAAAQREPVLLVGETGSGKTTLVQQIARQVRARARCCRRACACGRAHVGGGRAGRRSDARAATQHAGQHALRSPEHPHGPKLCPESLLWSER